MRLAGPSLAAGTDLDDVEAALVDVGALFDAIYDAGTSMLIRVDADRTGGANPVRFTVAISVSGPTVAPSGTTTLTSSGLVAKAVDDFDSSLGLVVEQLLERGLVADRIEVGVGLCGSAKLL
jgi:hypothetical protein